MKYGRRKEKKTNKGKNVVEFFLNIDKYTRIESLLDKCSHYISQLLKIILVEKLSILREMSEDAK